MEAKKYSKIKHVQKNYEWEEGRETGHKIHQFSHAATEGEQASKCALVSVERYVTAGALIIRMFACWMVLPLCMWSIIMQWWHWGSRILIHASRERKKKDIKNSINWLMTLILILKRNNGDWQTLWRKAVLSPDPAQEKTHNIFLKQG